MGGEANVERSVMLTIEEIDLILCGLSCWRSDFACIGDDWSDVDAIEAKLLRFIPVATELDES